MIRAAVLVDDRRLEIQELPRPTIGPDDGLLRVEASGICGTDVEQYHGDPGTMTRSSAASPMTW